MNAKEKAIELFDKHYYIIKGELKYPNEICKYKAKQCALICVDEILKTDPQLVMYIGDEIDPLLYEKECKGNTKYWQEVKREIEKK
jgi:hypothetical protein